MLALKICLTSWIIWYLMTEVFADTNRDSEVVVWIALIAFITSVISAFFAIWTIF